MMVSSSPTGTMDDNMDPDFRFCGFDMGLWRVHADAPALRGVAVFLLGFRDCELVCSNKAVASPVMFMSTLRSIGEVALEFGAVLGFV